MKVPKATFQGFLSKFPRVELPVRLNQEIHHTFARENTPLTEQEIERFIIPYESTEDDGHTEYVPCFSIEPEYDFEIIVYWRARLLSYEYFICTYTKNGLGMAKRKIAGMIHYGDKISQAIATIEKDWIIYVVQGESDSPKSITYNPKSTDSYTLEILTDGQIIFTLNEDLYT